MEVGQREAAAVDDLTSLGAESVAIVKRREWKVKGVVLFKREVCTGREVD